VTAGRPKTDTELEVRATLCLAAKWGILGCERHLDPRRLAQSTWSQHQFSHTNSGSEPVLVQAWVAGGQGRPAESLSLRCRRPRLPAWTCRGPVGWDRRIHGFRNSSSLVYDTAASAQDAAPVTDQANAATDDQVKTGHLRSVVMVASVGFVGQVLG
jgi:hypothetical protein